MSTNVMALDAEGDEPGTMMDGQQAMPGGYGIRVELGVFDLTQNRERVVLFGICCVGGFAWKRLWWTYWTYWTSFRSTEDNVYCPFVGA